MALRKTTGTIRPDSPRHAVWVEIFGSDTVFLEGPMTHILSAYGRDERFYMLDVTSLSDDVRDRLVAVMARTFGIAEEEVRDDIDQGRGIPILAQDVVVVVDVRHVL